MKRIQFLLIYIAVSQQILLIGFAEERSIPERKTWVMMVGLLEWEASTTYTPMDNSNRKDDILYRTLIHKGVPTQQITYLKCKDATLQNIKRRFSEMLKKTQKGDYLIVYFTGHGVINKHKEGFFVNYDALPGSFEKHWKVSDIITKVESEFNGSHVIMIADCCHSGTVGVEMEKRKLTKSYTSLASVELSKISTGKWTFTESLISALQGKACLDRNEDGKISLQEFHTYSRKEMAFFASQIPSFYSTENFPKNFSLSKSLNKTNPKLGCYYEIKINDRWRKAKIADIKNKKVTLSFYENDRIKNLTLNEDSNDLRPFKVQYYKKSQLVEAWDNGRWYPATILKVDKKLGLHYIHYNNYSIKYDCWLAYNYLRLKK